jgi:hypothetical protein
MNENQNEKDKFLVSDMSGIDKSKNPLSTTDDQIKKCHTFNRYFVNHKNISSFKLKLIKDINFIEKNLILFTILKFLLGLILLAIPFFIIIYFIYSDTSIRNNYLFFPYFISLSIIMGSFLIIFVIKLGDACRNYGIFIVSWERIYMFKILKLIIASLFLLWLLFLCEEFVINFNLLREKVAQSNNKETSSKIFNEGTYSIRLLFILLLWDTETNDEGSYNHEKIGYFEYEGTFFNDFHDSLSKLLIPILCLCFLFLIKIIFIKTKREIIYGILYIITLFECFYFLFNKPSNQENLKINNNSYKNIFLNDYTDNKDNEEEYFYNNNGKYFEIIPMAIIIFILVILNFRACILDLIHKKYYSFNSKKKNKFIFYTVVSSFVLNTLGYGLFLFLLLLMYFRTINSEMNISTYKNYWAMIYISFSLIIIGYSFQFGNYCFKLMYHPTAYEIYDHILKNEFYINCSGNLRKNFNYYQKKEKEKRNQNNISF